MKSNKKKKLSEMSILNRMSMNPIMIIIVIKTYIWSGNLDTYTENENRNEIENWDWKKKKLHRSQDEIAYYCLYAVLFDRRSLMDS